MGSVDYMALLVLKVNVTVKEMVTMYVCLYGTKLMLGQHVFCFCIRRY